MQPRNLTVVSGPAGCGKTTLLSALAEGWGVPIDTLVRLSVKDMEGRLFRANARDRFIFDDLRGEAELAKVEALATQYPALYFVAAVEI